MKPDLKIIIVEDFNTIRIQVTKLLNDMGFSNIHEADDGHVAWTTLMEADAIGEPFELVIADINMPVMNGIELLDKVRAEYGKLPFIIISAESEKEMILRALQLQVDNYIIKPVTAENLRDRLQKIFR